MPLNSSPLCFISLSPLNPPVRFCSTFCRTGAQTRERICWQRYILVTFLCMRIVQGPPNHPRPFCMHYSSSYERNNIITLFPYILERLRFMQNIVLGQRPRQSLHSRMQGLPIIINTASILLGTPCNTNKLCHSETSCQDFSNLILRLVAITMATICVNSTLRQFQVLDL